MLSNPTILVFTDFGHMADLALKSAEVMRKKVGGRIHAIHVSDFTIQWDWVAQGSNYIFQSEKFTSDMLTMLQKTLADQLKRCEVACDSSVTFGSVYDAIQESIKKNNPDIVIMGHKGKNNGVFNLGGIVSKVVASSSVPVLVIKKLLTSPLGKVAGLVDTSDFMKPIILATEEFSFLLSAEPEIISLWKNVTSQFYNLAPIEKVHPLLDLRQEVKEAILNKMREEIFKNLDEHSKSHVRVEITEEKQVAYHLAKILFEENVDMIIMKRHQKSRLEKMLIGSETRRMLELFLGNVLVLPP
jgi:nucleotide-binding universal stress UspA family protein